MVKKATKKKRKSRSSKVVVSESRYSMTSSSDASRKHPITKSSIKLRSERLKRNSSSDEGIVGKETTAEEQNVMNHNIEATEPLSIKNDSGFENFQDQVDAITADRNSLKASLCSLQSSFEQLQSKNRVEINVLNDKLNDANNKIKTYSSIENLIINFFIEVKYLFEDTNGDKELNLVKQKFRLRKEYEVNPNIFFTNFANHIKDRLVELKTGSQQELEIANLKSKLDDLNLQLNDVTSRFQQVAKDKDEIHNKLESSENGMRLIAEDSKRIINELVSDKHKLEVKLVEREQLLKSKVEELDIKNSVIQAKDKELLEKSLKINNKYDIIQQRQQEYQKLKLEANKDDSIKRLNKAEEDKITLTTKLENLTRELNSYKTNIKLAKFKELDERCKRNAAALQKVTAKFTKTCEENRMLKLQNDTKDSKINSLYQKSKSMHSELLELRLEHDKKNLSIKEDVNSIISLKKQNRSLEMQLRSLNSKLFHLQNNKQKSIAQHLENTKDEVDHFMDHYSRRIEEEEKLATASPDSPEFEEDISQVLSDLNRSVTVRQTSKTIKANSKLSRAIEYQNRNSLLLSSPATRSFKKRPSSANSASASSIYRMDVGTRSSTNLH